jgi:hypothetical protein
MSKSYGLLGRTWTFLYGGWVLLESGRREVGRTDQGKRTAVLSGPPWGLEQYCRMRM